MKKLIRKLLCWAFPEIKERLSSMKKDYTEQLNLSKQILEGYEEQLKICQDANNLAGHAMNIIKLLLQNFEVSVDIHEKEGSWAVISLQGEKKTLIKFIDLSDKDIQEIAMFLRNFERRKIDAHPQIKKWMEVEL